MKAMEQNAACQEYFGTYPLSILESVQSVENCQKLWARERSMKSISIHSFPQCRHSSVILKFKSN